MNPFVAPQSSIRGTKPGRKPPKHRTPRKGEILGVAAELFAEHGYGSVSMIEIANAAKLSKTSLYHYFETKEQILGTIVVTTISELNQFIANMVPATGAPEDRLRACIEAQAFFFEQNQMSCKVLLTQLGSLTDLESRDAAVEWRVKYENFLSQIIQDGINQGRFDENMHASMIRAIMGSLYWLVRWYRPDSSTSAQQIASEYADLLLNGIIRNPEL